MANRGQDKNELIPLMTWREQVSPLTAVRMLSAGTLRCRLPFLESELCRSLFQTTVAGSYPRSIQPADTLKKPTLDREQADETIRWAVKDQVSLGLDIVADGEGRRENMYYFVQKRVDGLSFDQMEYRSYGTAGFGIEIAAVVGKIENPRIELAHDWKVGS
jgi:methionine synthase II (cobalamin-independent)